MLGTYAGQVTGFKLPAWPRASLRACVPRLAWLRKTAAAIEAGAPIEAGERVLVAARERSGAMVIATGHAIYCQDHRDAGSWSRLGWEDVGRVGWDDRAQALILTRLRGDGPPDMILRLPGHAAFAGLASERVASTVLASAPVLSGGRVCGRLTARRRPGDDHVRWVLALTDPAAARDPALRARVSGTIAALEAELGIESRQRASRRDTGARGPTSAQSRPRGG